ncbi:MAG: ABC transporter transmembrane domain-containing protein [Bacteroidota bacterium]|nr:ABC transporter transmembrane domain-containing protein [Candidatus Kapabacteria bacterium]MDW8221109.1 ABC transporter transmembrane domain-containing protein [Bacteroidota bacterium]
MAKRRARSSDDTPKLTPEQSREQLVFLLGFLAPYRWSIGIALVALVLSSAVSLAFPALIGKLIDVMLHEHTSPYSLGTIVAVLIAVLIVQSVARFFTSMTLATITENTLARLRTMLFERIVHLPMAFFGERRVGELSSRLSSDVSLIQETLTFTFLELLRQSVFFLGSLIVITRQSLQLTGMILLVLPVLVAIALVFARYIRKYSRDVQDALADAATIVEETLQGIAGVKSFVNEHYEVARYASTIKRGVAIALKGAKVRSAFVSFIMFALFGGIAGVIWYGGNLVRNGAMTMGDLTSFIIYTTFVGGALGSFAELFGQIQRTLGASMRVRELLNEQPENTRVHLDAQAHSAQQRILRSVEFVHVTFCYPSRQDVPALRNVSLHIRAGERVALVGESGAGKSTIASLIQRLYEVDVGEIRFDGIPARHLSLHEVRDSVGVVPQDIVLFGGTIADNIRYGKLSASDDEVWKAAELANATEFIERFPAREQTLVGERGVKLSGGQRQRIAIARAILKNPPILILDEATSSLDSHTEYLIQEAMERLMQGRTTIIIAHRLSTVRRCDTIIVLSKGKVVEQGTHEALLAQENSLYAKLCALQFGDTEHTVAS